MSTLDLLVVCLSVLGCYAMYLFSVHEQSKALRLALDTNEDVVAEAAKSAAVATGAAAEAATHRAAIAAILEAHSVRIGNAEMKLNKLVMR
jgi:hypothetical protein